MAITKRNEATPMGRKTFVDPVTGKSIVDEATGKEKKGAVVPIAQIRAQEIWAKIRPYIEQHEVFGNRLVVAVYKTPEKTENGVYLPESFREEDVWQGVTGLIIQKGPGCFQDTDKWKFYGQSAEVGDWVTFQPPHSILQKIGGRIDGLECRIIQDCYLIAKVSGPTLVS